MAGISASGLELRGIVDEGAEIGRGERDGPGGDGVAAGEVRQIGAERSRWRPFRPQYDS